jgi:predicted ribosome quality control (RQC) complex YloA/Tae2 family protein
MLEWLTRLPRIEPFPQISHFLAMFGLFLSHQQTASAVDFLALNMPTSQANSRQNRMHLQNLSKTRAFSVIRTHWRSIGTMSLNAEEIAEVAKILNTSLQNAVVQKVLSEEARNRLILVMRGFSETEYLRISLDAAFSRIARIRDLPPRSLVPHPFVMLLRKTLVGRRVRRVEAVNGDRVIRLLFHPDSDGTSLTCELTSRHANAFLVNADGTIAGSFFPNRSSLRRLIPGEPYISPFPHPVVETKSRFENLHSLEDDIEAFYRNKEAEVALDELRVFVLRKITSAQKKAEKLLFALHSDLERARQGETYAAFGHLLKTALSKVTKGQTEFRGQDFEGCEIIVPLDPAQGPVDNMNRLFDKAKRLTRAVPPIEARIETTARTIQDLTIKEAVARAADAETLHSLDVSFRMGTAVGDISHKSGRRIPAERMPFREFIIYSGRPARVGRSARDNDELTLRHAKPDDLWLHVRNATGSHVVVPMGRKEDPHPNLLIDAAHLAVHFSSLKGQKDVEVLYTRRRYVQKQKGSAPGAVRLIKEKSIALRVEEERLKHILLKESPYKD